MEGEHGVSAGGTRVTLRPWARLVGPMVGGTVAVLVGVGSLAYGDDAATYVWGSACLLLGVPLLCSQARLRVEADGSGLVIVNSLTPARIVAWSEVSGVEFGRDARGDTWLLIRDPSGHPHTIAATRGLPKDQRRELWLVLSRNLGPKVGQEVEGGWLQQERSVPRSQA